LINFTYLLYLHSLETKLKHSDGLRFKLIVYLFLFDKSTLSSKSQYDVSE